MDIARRLNGGVDREADFEVELLHRLAEVMREKRTRRRASLGCEHGQNLFDACIHDRRNLVQGPGTVNGRIVQRLGVDDLGCIKHERPSEKLSGLYTPQTGPETRLSAPLFWARRRFGCRGCWDCWWRSPGGSPRPC